MTGPSAVSQARPPMGVGGAEATCTYAVSGAVRFRDAPAVVGG